MNRREKARVDDLEQQIAVLRVNLSLANTTQNTLDSTLRRTL